MANGTVTEPIEGRRISEIPPIKTLTLKMTGAMSAETSQSFEHSVQLIPESRRHNLSSLRENLRKKHCLILLCEVNTKVLTLQSARDLLITPVTSARLQTALSDSHVSDKRAASCTVCELCSTATWFLAAYLQLKGKFDISDTFLGSSHGLLYHVQLVPGIIKSRLHCKYT
jgi:hypothetical protein